MDARKARRHAPHRPAGRRRDPRAERSRSGRACAARGWISPCWTKPPICIPTCGAPAIRPALADRRGEALFLSTPNGRNWFWGLYMLGQQNAADQWQSWRFPTRANPLIDPAEIEAAREPLPERLFSRNIEAEFLPDAGGVFRGVEAAASVEPRAKRPKPESATYSAWTGAASTITQVWPCWPVKSRRARGAGPFQQHRLGLAAGAAGGAGGEMASRRRSGRRRTASAGRISRRCQTEGLPVIPFTMTASSKAR